MSEVLPVNNEILKWARETIGLSEDDVATRIKKTVEVIKEWESGIAAPSYSVLEKLAYEVYKRPVAVFFFPSVPEEQNTRAEFRTLPGEIVDAMPSSIIKMYRKAKVFQLNLAELYNNKKPVMEPLLDKFKLDYRINVKNFAAEIRDFLGIDLAQQRIWNSADTGIKVWRDAFFQKGIFVFKEAFLNDEYSGLCVYSQDYPAILINNSMPKTRQIFTMFHELGHLLFNSGGVDLPAETFAERLSGNYLRLEQKCNEFAGELLFPEHEFLSLGMSFSEDAVIELANRYKVSREVVLRKYLNTRQIDVGVYKRFTDTWSREFFAERSSKKADGGNPYLTRKAYLGEAYINLVFGRYFQGQFSAEHLAGYLGVKVKNLSTFEGYALG
ncbi:DNA-binding protein [Spirochaetia bacterium]|nr:DNA-binding protein [Spirochaetia bacterium]